MTKRYKATRPDGTDFYSGTVDYAAALASGETITHTDRRYKGWPNGHPHRDAGYYLSVATVPTDCTGFSWPCRLFEVETVDEWTPGAEGLPNKRATLSLRVVAELDASAALGPQGPLLVKLFEQARNVTPEQLRALGAAGGAAWDAARDAAGGAARDAAGGAARDAARDAAGGAARDAAWDAARGAARDAAGGAAWDAARDAAWDAAWALVVRDLITAEQYETLAGPWISVMGELS